MAVFPPNSLCQRPTPASTHELTKFHTDEYITFLQKIKVDMPQEVYDEGPRCKQTSDTNLALDIKQTHGTTGNIDDDTDNPFMDGALEFAQLYTGASISTWNPFALFLTETI